VDKSTVSAQVRRLERHDLVSRHGHPEDGRVVMLEANERGRQLRSRLRAQGSAIIDQALADWSERDRRALGVLLERLAHSLQVTTAVADGTGYPSPRGEETGSVRERTPVAGRGAPRS
jgi:DNA-binding transcriptional ArsR family regulator